MKLEATLRGATMLAIMAFWNIAGSSVQAEPGKKPMGWTRPHGPGKAEPIYASEPERKPRKNNLYRGRKEL